MQYTVTLDRKLYKDGKFYMNLDITYNVFEFLSTIKLSNQQGIYRNITSRTVHDGYTEYETDNFIIKISSGDKPKKLKFINHEIKYKFFDIDINNAKGDKYEWSEIIENYFTRVHFDVDYEVEINEMIEKIIPLLETSFPIIKDKLKLFVLKNKGCKKYHIITNLTTHVGIFHNFIKSITCFKTDYNPYASNIICLRKPYFLKKGKIIENHTDENNMYIPYVENDTIYNVENINLRDYYITPDETDIIYTPTKEELIEIAFTNIVRAECLTEKRYEPSTDTINIYLYDTLLKSITPCNSKFIYMDGLLYNDFEVKNEELLLESGLIAIIKSYNNKYTKIKNIKVVDLDYKTNQTDLEVINDQYYLLGKRPIKTLKEHPTDRYYDISNITKNKDKLYINENNIIYTLNN